MKTSYKLFFKYILFTINNIFLNYSNKNEKNLNIFVSSKYLYYLALHFKLSSLFYSTQLIDIFSYETQNNTNNIASKNALISATSTNVLVYNFHNILTNQRFFVFSSVNSSISLKKNFFYKNTTTSVTEIFLNANWLEREVSELHSIFFFYKKDLRNLMLPYGDTSAPMRKIFPSIGTKEIFYDVSTDTLILSPVTIQF